MPTDLSQDSRDRTFRFACAIATLVLSLKEHRLRSIKDQLLRFGTSVGSNLEEAKAASSRKEFLRYVQISLRESRESIYWLRICAELKFGPEAQLHELSGEGDQIARIPGAIVVITKRRMLAKHILFAFCILNFALLNSALLLSS
jgi:four helix bundle protein